MTRPGPINWASNATWAGGLDPGLTTKTPPSAGQQADGYYRDLRVAARIWNYREWAYAEKLRAASSMRPYNWSEADFTAFGVAGSTGGPCDIVYDDIGMIATIINADNIGGGAPLFETWTSQNGGAEPTGGLYYLGALTPAVPPAAAGPRIDLDPVTFTRAIATGAVGDVPRFSIAYAAWAVWGGGTPAGTFVSIKWTQVGSVWIMGDAAGVVTVSTGPGVAFAVPGVAVPGFAAAPVTALCASNHAATDVYPDDPGNDVVVAMTLTEVSTSSGACTTWTAAALHGLGSQPRDLAYCKATGRFICTLANGNVGVSDDNGATWSVVAVINTSTHARIACDGFGEWVVTKISGGPVGQIFQASVDDGDTWIDVHRTAYIGAPSAVALCYGGGRFHAVTQKAIGGAGLAQVWVTPRAIG